MEKHPSTLGYSKRVDSGQQRNMSLLDRSSRPNALEKNYPMTTKEHGQVNGNLNSLMTNTQTMPG